MVRPNTVELAVVTALKEELEPILNLLAAHQPLNTFSIDNFIHYYGTVGSHDHQSLSIAATSLWKYGGDPTVASVSRLKELSPKLLVMTGICAGWEVTCPPKAGPAKMGVLWG